jgi:hypothetical protein
MGLENNWSLSLRGIIMSERLSLITLTLAIGLILRGPVETEAEKIRLHTIAKQTPEVTKVDDQLEVKKAPSSTEGAVLNKSDIQQRQAWA